MRACIAEQARVRSAVSGLQCPVDRDWPVDRAWLNYGELARSLEFWCQLILVCRIEMMFETLPLTVSTPR